MTPVQALQPLRREALRGVIVEPARLAGLQIDDDLVTQLVTDTQSGEALPLLAYALAYLSADTRRGDRLSASVYAELGGVQGLLARQADAALAEASKRSGRSPDMIIRELLRLVVVDDRSRPTRWRLRLDTVPDQVRVELNPFVARRLLITDEDDGPTSSPGRSRPPAPASAGSTGRSARGG